MSRYTLRSHSLWIILAQLVAGSYIACASAAEPSIELESIATIKGTNAMQYVGTVTTSAQQNQLYIPIVEVPIGAKGGGVSVVSVALDGDKKALVIFHQDFDKNKPGVPPTMLPAVYEDAAGNLTLLANLRDARNVIAKLSKQGEIVSRRQLFDEDPDTIIRSSTLGSRGDLLVVGSSHSHGVALLVNSDLKVVWQQEFGKDVGKFCQIVGAQYNPTLKRFAIVGFSGTYSKFGVPEKGDSHVMVTTLDYEGKVVADKAFLGQRPSMASDSAEIVLLYENLTEPRTASLCRLTWDLVVVKEGIDKEFIRDLPAIGNMPNVTIGDKHRIIATSRSSTPASSVVVYDSDLKLVVKHTDERTLSSGHPFPLRVGNVTYLISTGRATPPAPKTPLANDVFLDRIVLK